MISAKIICDSISPQGHRLTTFLLRYPKFIHSEFMTHRMFSRNASSSRAVPVSKNIEEVRSDELRAAPVFWGAEQKGMSPGGELDNTMVEITSGKTAKELAINAWNNAAILAADTAQFMSHLGAHKSIVNRVLEPFLHINTLVTATEYMNFFGLRLDSGADPTMRALAEAMWKEYQASTPKLLQPGKWHMPFIEPFDDPMDIDDAVGEREFPFRSDVPLLIPVSIARCARLSYTSFETGKRSTIEEDLKLYDRLVGAQPLHASPAEHQATPDEEAPHNVNIEWSLPTNTYNPPRISLWRNPEQQGNFIGWRQYRKMLSGESLAPLPEEYSK